MKVLYASDGFEAAIDAGRLLGKIADKQRIKVTVLSVTHRRVPALEHLPVMLDPLASRREDSLEIVNVAASQLNAAGFEVRGQTAEGHPGQEIVHAVESDWYDLIVMGAGQRSWMGRRLLGSVSTHLLHASPSSVLIVHEAPLEDGPARALVGADGSQGSDFTIETLARFADPARTEIEVATVVEEHAVLMAQLFGEEPPSPQMLDEFDQLNKKSRARAQRNADAAATHLRDAGFRVEAHIGEGSPAEQLLKEADGGRFDLVAVGSRGLGPFRRALMGSVSDHVVRHSRAALVGRQLAT
jgi:nucleotide-binding universal stress UspA family protein